MLHACGLAGGNTLTFGCVCGLSARQNMQNYAQQIQGVGSEPSKKKERFLLLSFVFDSCFFGTHVHVLTYLPLSSW